MSRTGIGHSQLSANDRNRVSIAWPRVGLVIEKNRLTHLESSIFLTELHLFVSYEIDKLVRK